MNITNVLGETRKVEKHYEDGHYICPFCNYPALYECHNPRCTANPFVSLSVASRWTEEDAKHAAEKAEREYLQRAREASYKRAYS